MWGVEMTTKEKKEIDNNKISKLDNYIERLVALKDKLAQLGLADKETDTHFNQILALIDVIKEKIINAAKCGYYYVKHITSALFDSILDTVESIKDVSFVDGFYPTVEMLDAYKVKDNISKYIHMLMFYASDPFMRNNEEGKDEKEYRMLVKYCKQLVAQVDIKE